MLNKTPFYDIHEQAGAKLIVDKEAKITPFRVEDEPGPGARRPPMLPTI